MKEEKTIHLHWTPEKQRQAPASGPAAWTCRVLFGAAVLAGALGALCSGGSDNPWLHWGLGLGVYVLASALFATKFRLPGLCVSAGGILAASLAAREQLQAGFSVLVNGWLQILSVQQGKLYPLFTADEAALPYAVIWISCALALFTAWGAQRQAWLLLLPGAGVACGCILKLWPGHWLLLALLGLLGLLLTDRGSQWQRGIPALLGAAVLLNLFLPVRSAMESAGQAARNAIADGLHRCFYESGATSMPEGRLGNLGSWEKSEITALEIAMDAPQKLYLRGYVGEYYTGTGWTVLPPDTLEGQQDLFYWLHKEGFFAQTEPSQAERLANLGEAANLTVTVENACRRWAYLPYGLSSDGALDAAAFPDAGTALRQQVYTAPYQTGSLAQWYQAQGLLAVSTVDSPFLARESAYRDFVYGAYLQLPDTTVQALAQLMQEEEASLTLPEIQEKIRAYLAEAMCYDETVTTQNGSMDFLPYVLMAQGRGYSVHYATIAACLLRYYGVPARYVEGYFLPADKAAALEPGEVLALDESYAHAWAEFYLDGVGWIPFEVTPGYLDQEEADLQGLLADPDSPLHQSLNQTYETQQYQAPQAFVQQPETQEPGGESPWAQLSWRLVWLVPGLLLLALLIRCLYLRARLGRRLRTLRAAQPREAVAGLYAYCRSLWLMAGFAPGEALDWEPVEQANREALFSQHPMTTEQKRLAVDFLEEVRSYLRSHLPLRQRLWLQWVRCFCQ